jgi:hypothetical protein
MLMRFALFLKMEPILCPETLVKYYHWTLRNIPEERKRVIGFADVHCVAVRLSDM